ncbi:MAG TPA: ATP-binding protein, partial [Kofleriaceae bacterium]|nr:ATP-binding protein [Kofleriaceae bacterium]
RARPPRAPIVELDVAGQSAAWDGSPYPEPPRTAMLIPLQPAGAAAPVAALIAGVSARRALDPAYRAFYESLGSVVTGAIANVRAYLVEQERAAALAEINRAKTAFFSNVSHEFRTPLTLLLGPLDHLLATASRADQRDELALVQRNGQRLLKLVNSLLDFSRIEAGRAQASFEPVDLATLTADLASTFRSLIEKAGLALVVDCPPLPAPVWVDREMFEKIVLNLISNAFKFTFAGEIRVALRARDGAVELSVRDTGTGIPAHELARIFERFHRVQGARGRSYEGSGIGLALVQELVKQHGGQIRATSQLGEGTTFTVALRAGTAHLPPEQLRAERTLASTRADAGAYLSEAEQWLAGAPSVGPPVDAARAMPDPARARVTGRVLLADDNADMRAYVARLLDGPFVVEAVGDGQAALDAARARPPDLVLSDVMMPVLDGFGLLAQLKADPRTAQVPVILLSARAGEEATIEGLRAGASDYLVKPFHARELIARVEGTILIARAQARLTAVLDTMSDGFCVLDREWRFVAVNASFQRLTQRARADVLGRDLWALFPAGVAAHRRRELERCMAARTAVQFQERDPTLDRWLDVQAYPVPEGGIAVFFRDVTSDKHAELVLRRDAEFQQQLVGIVSHDLRNPLNTIVLAASVLLHSEIDERARRPVLRLQAAAERATRLVRDLLDFTQAQLGGGIPVVPAPLDFHACIAQAVDELRAAFPDRELRLAADGAGDGRGAWDADRLAQVVQNLVSNAVKYSTPGTPITVRTAADVRGVSLVVHNQGAPIPERDRPNLFAPMRRGAHGVDRNAGSVGLGLFIVDHIVRAHHGTIAVRSTADDGTAFTVWLPRAAPAGRGAA